MRRERLCLAACGHKLRMAEEEQRLLEEARRSRQETEELREEAAEAEEEAGNRWAKTSSGDAENVTEDD
jgi:hypothetical protein